MLTKTRMAVVAMILFGSSSGAPAEAYDPDAFRPIAESNVSSIVNTRLQLERRNATRFTAEERAQFDRASHLF